jgi:hypothetical protein
VLKQQREELEQLQEHDPVQHRAKKPVIINGTYGESALSGYKRSPLQKTTVD